MTRLQGIGIAIGLAGAFRQSPVMIQTFFEVFFGFVHSFGISAEVVIQNQDSSPHLFGIKTAHQLNAVHIIPKPLKLLLIACNQRGCLFNRLYSRFRAADGFLDDGDRGFALVGFTGPFFSGIFIETFTGRGKPFPQAADRTIRFGIDQLIQEHAQRQGLAIAFCDTQAAQQQGSTVSGFIIGLEDLFGGLGIAVHLAQPPDPIALVLSRVSVRAPQVAGPGLKPDPVALNLFERGFNLIRCLGPVPVGQGVQVHALSAQAVTAGQHTASDEVLGAVAKGLQIGKQVYIDHMG